MNMIKIEKNTIFAYYKKMPENKNLQDPAFEVEAGAPLGCFELGSTVVLLFENDKERFVPNPDLQVGQKIKLGSLLGRWEDKD